jgi:hypothetical protein
VEASFVGPWCMNLRSVGWCSFFGGALLVGADVCVSLHWVAVVPLGSGDCLQVVVGVFLVSLGAHRIGDLGATEMHSRRSW